MKKPHTVALETEYENDLISQPIPYPEYPRPQFKRDSFINLNGKWDFSIRQKDKIRFEGKILVPFVPESRISGVEKEIRKGDLLIYTRKFTIDESFIKNRVILHIGACDQKSVVFINGFHVGSNIGGYLPFSFDITDSCHIGENTIKIEAADDMDTSLPYGKQTAKRGGMWYTKISGIWQTVWLESVPGSYIERIKITPDLNGIDIEVFGGNKEKKINFQGKEYTFEGNRFRLDVENPVHWSPENPFLYEFTIESGEDKVESYFALRTIDIKAVNGRQMICLNGFPYFFHGLLDQGYYSDGIFLPGTSKGFFDDIFRMKECGFNMLRKHIKLEPQLFYYYCDKLGMIVFQDFINSGKYSFIIDTALPTIGFKKGISHRASAKRRREFEKTALGIADALYNHPCVVYYTIFNEGWGQFNADGYYDYFKSNDPTRIYDSTSGWFTEKKSDVESPHIYFKPVKIADKRNRPTVLSEFGGYSYKVEGHSFNLDNNYGYRNFNSTDELEKGLVSLYEKEIIPAIEAGLNGAVLTQVSDVEDETNGLLTYDRKVQKVDSKRMKAVAEQQFDKFREIHIEN